MSEEPERELEDMEHRADGLGEDIDEARKEWERKKADPRIPGAPEDQSDEDT